MNERLPNLYSQLSLVNVNAQTPAEIRQVFATVNNLISQFNQLIALAGGLSSQIDSVLNSLNNLYPYDGSNDPGYISNSVMLDWPNAHYALKATISSVLTTIFDITIDGTPSTVFTANAGAMEVRSGEVYFDSSHNYGVVVDGSDLALVSDGLVGTTSVFQAGGYKSADGSDGATATTGGATFKNGLYIEGTISGSGDPGTVEETPDDNVPCARLNNGGGVWQPLSTYFDGLVAGTDWTGSTAITTVGEITTGIWSGTPITELGTVTSGVWQGTPIADDYLAETYLTANETITLSGDVAGSGETAITATIANGAVTLAKMADCPANRILGNDTASAIAPKALTASEAKSLLSLNNVENTKLSTWAGSTAITTLGAVTTCASLAVNSLTGDVSGHRMQMHYLRPFNDGDPVLYEGNGWGVTDSGVTKWVFRCDTTNNICYAKTLKADSLRPISVGGYTGVLNSSGSTWIIYCDDASLHTYMPKLTVTTALIIPQVI